MTELDSAHLVRKTEAGLAAIKERDRSLAPRARTLLILVDGSKTVSQLAALNTDAAQGLELLGQLLQRGFIQLEQAGASASATMSPPPAAAVPRPADRDLPGSIRIATRFLEGMMGPGSESLNLQLERCKSMGEFEAKVHEITRLLAQARFAKRAGEFSAAALGR